MIDDLQVRLQGTNNFVAGAVGQAAEFITSSSGFGLPGSEIQLDDEWYVCVCV